MWPMNKNEFDTPALFGVPEAGKSLSEKQANVISLTSSKAFWVILLRCKKPLPPPLISGLHDAVSFLELEKKVFPKVFQKQYWNNSCHCMVL